MFMKLGLVNEKVGRWKKRFQIIDRIMYNGKLAETERLAHGRITCRTAVTRQDMPH